MVDAGLLLKRPERGDHMSVETRHALDERSFDHSVIRWIMKSVGNPRVSVRLWNGDEFTVTEERPVACMEFRSRRAVFELLRSPSVGFGECYSRGLIAVHGDFLAFANEITAAIARHRNNSYYVSKLRTLLHAMRGQALRVRGHRDGEATAGAAYPDAGRAPDCRQVADARDPGDRAELAQLQRGGQICLPARRAPGHRQRPRCLQ